MLWEQTARVWAPLALAAGLLAVAGLWGAFEALSQTLHGAITAGVLMAGLLFAGLGARRISWPGRSAALRRLERDSTFADVALSTLDEGGPAVGDTRLWDLHRARVVEALRGVRIGRPRAGLAAADPFALRYLLVAAAVLALWVRGPDHPVRAVVAFRPVLQAGAASVGAIARFGRSLADRVKPGAAHP